MSRKKRAATSPATESTDVATVVAPKDQVISWLLEGHRDADIVQAIKEKWPEANPEAMLNGAVDHFQAAGQCDLNILVGWGLEAYRDLYRRMIAIGDFANALKAVKELTALAGKYCVRNPDEGDDATTENDGQKVD